MDFGQALEALKEGKKVTRPSWLTGRSDEEVFIFLVPGSTFQVNRAPLLGIYPAGTEIKYQSHVDMKTANNTVVPWVCTQDDMLGEDWEVVV